jgi:hypothetical protein
MYHPIPPASIIDRDMLMPMICSAAEFGRKTNVRDLGSNTGNVNTVHGFEIVAIKDHWRMTRKGKALCCMWINRNKSPQNEDREALAASKRAFQHLKRSSCESYRDIEVNVKSTRNPIHKTPNGQEGTGKS